MRTLAKPDAEFLEPFSQIDGLRELRDGRVIIVDSRERSVHVVDFSTGASTRIGRTGDGPREYRWPARLFALPGDSTLLYDQSAGRLMVITPDAKPGEFIELNPPPTTETLRARRFNIRQSDALGRLYGEAQPVRVNANGAIELTHASAIERLDRATGKRDTVAYWPQRKDAGARLMGGIVVTRPRTQPFPGWDHWLVAPDGRIALVYVDPYRVDFVAPNGVLTKGRPIPFEPVRVDAALKARYREERQRPMMAVRGTRDGRTVMGPMAMPYSEPTEWPEKLPPFLSGAPRFDSYGTLWIKRTTPVGEPTRFDLIDKNGRVFQQVVLPGRAKFVGFGNGTVYIARLDDDDLQYLQRYRF